MPNPVVQVEHLSERVLMRCHRLGKLSVLALAMCAGRASAFLDPPYITPAHPTTGQLISVNIYGDECDLVDMGIVWPPPVTQQESEITILFTGVHESDPEFCFYRLGTSTYPVGAFPRGTYALDVERRYMSFSGPWIQETLGVIPFTVSAAPSQQPIEAPTLTVEGLGALALALLTAAQFAPRPQHIAARFVSQKR